MHADRPSVPRAFVQPIHVLRHEQHPISQPLLQLHQRSMRRIWRCCRCIAPPRVVESVNEVRIPRKSLGRRYLLGPVPLPKPASIAKRGKPAFR